MAQEFMDSNEGGFAELPPEIIERVLSFLPVPVLCRLRSVCKAWNEILCKPSFHNLRDLNGKREAYLFLTHYVPYGGGGRRPEHRIDPLFRRRATFLDVDARRWYSTSNADDGAELEIVSVSMNDGLVCELARYPGDGGDYALFIADPVANTRRELPALPMHSWADGVCPTTMVSVDNTASTFLVYFVVCTKQAETKMYVYESSSSEWRALASPPKEERLADAASAVVFHGILYVVFNARFPNTMCSLLSYNLQEDLWRVLKVSILRCSQEKGPDPQVFLTNNELWMTRWYHNSEYPWMEDDLYFELASIRIINNSSVETKAVIEMAHEMIDYRLGEPYDSKSFAYPFPCTLDNDSDDIWNPMIWMSDLSGRTIIYEFADDWVDLLPAHPVGETNKDMTCQSDMSDEEDDSFSYYRAWCMNLSMRNILSPGPVAIDPRA